MNLVNELDQKLELLRSQGYEVRYEWLGGAGGGACQFGAKKFLFLDLAQGAPEHLTVVEQTLGFSLPPHQWASPESPQQPTSNSPARRAA